MPLLRLLTRIPGWFAQSCFFCIFLHSLSLKFFKLKGRCSFSLNNFLLVLPWLEWFLWPFKRRSMVGYLWTGNFLVLLFKNIRSYLMYLNGFQLVHRNNIFNSHQQNKSSVFKAMFRQARNRCRKVFDAVNLVQANEARDCITSQRIVSCDFWCIANNVLNC